MFQKLLILYFHGQQPVEFTKNGAKGKKIGVTIDIVVKCVKVMVGSQAKRAMELIL